MAVSTVTMPSLDTLFTVKTVEVVQQVRAVLGPTDAEPDTPSC